MSSLIFRYCQNNSKNQFTSITFVEAIQINYSTKLRSVLFTYITKVNKFFHSKEIE